MQLRTLLRVALGMACVTLLGMPGWVAAQSGSATVLKPAEVEKVFPATVFYCGQSAPTQMRNSGGLKFSDNHVVLASLVDTSGYSTGVAAKYQGYLITEVPIEVGGEKLPAGAYGFGFLPGDQFLVTDLGGADILKVSSKTDAALERPRPLQIVSDPAGGYRLYAGRSYIQLSR